MSCPSYGSSFGSRNRFIPSNWFTMSCTWTRVVDGVENTLPLLLLAAGHGTGTFETRDINRIPTIWLFLDRCCSRWPDLDHLPTAIIISSAFLTHNFGPGVLEPVFSREENEDGEEEVLLLAAAQPLSLLLLLLLFPIKRSIIVSPNNNSSSFLVPPPPPSFLAVAELRSALWLFLLRFLSSSLSFSSSDVSSMSMDPPPLPRRPTDALETTILLGSSWLLKITVRVRGWNRWRCCQVIVILVSWLLPCRSPIFFIRVRKREWNWGWEVAADERRPLFPMELRLTPPLPKELFFEWLFVSTCSSTIKVTRSGTYDWTVPSVVITWTACIFWSRRSGYCVTCYCFWGVNTWTITTWTVSNLFFTKITCGRPLIVRLMMVFVEGDGRFQRQLLPLFGNLVPHLLLLLQ